MSTTVPAALSALVTAFSAALGADVQVIDGPLLETEPDFCAVGWAPDDHPGVTLDLADADLRNRSRSETFDVNCVLSSWRGDATIDGARARAFAMFDTVRDALGADRTLGGAVTRAAITAVTLDQSIENAGAVATIPFTVHIEAWS